MSLIEGDDEDAEKKANEFNKLILYVVEPVMEQNGDSSSWEGQVSVLKRHIERTNEKTQNMLAKRVEKVHDRVIEAESRDATQEREMKQGMEKLMRELNQRVSKQEENLKEEINKSMEAILLRLDGTTHSSAADVASAANVRSSARTNSKQI